MTKSRARTVIANSVTALVRFIMKTERLSKEDAYFRLCGTELFRLLRNDRTSLYLEPNVQLTKLYKCEREHGVDALYSAVANY